MHYFDFYVYVITVILMIAMPGPVMILVASAGLQGGYRSALRTIVGTNLASLVLIAVAILILKGLFSLDQLWFVLIKLLGCGYIAYLGWGMLNEFFQSQLSSTEKVIPRTVGLKKGFLVGISNPKDIVFFSAFFPQFITVHSNINISLSILVCTWIILDFITLSVVYFAFNRLSQTAYYQKILALCGLILILIAVYGAYVSLSRLFL
ncbi:MULTISPECIES: LysE family translocator [unclassified Acinetobacter]|uniref:LysE family translocator n=1 Tax=unclassified Acinetobacter TaxID=196816 RepID=UPI002934BE59|nr:MULTISPECIES: LysE family translocator [unclassified Acinetobacter]WOE30731.1 LysE family translocator [Acinetobacter sp. SAAs470]WOE38924.1 LysE family translocator [Acinetobacter sp. SAAs474]